MRLPSLAVLALAGLAAGQSSQNMVLESTIPFPACTTGDVTAIGDYMILARRSQGFAVIDARVPKNPVVKTIYPPGYPISSVRSYGVGDIKADDRYIYATNEGTSAGGVFIFDALDPMNPKYLATAGSGNGSVHNCWIDPTTKRLYTNGGYIYDVSNPSNPTYITRLNVGFAHDVIVLDNVAYYSLWNSGMGIYDVTNPLAVKQLARQSWSGAYCHNMWPSDDRKTLYTTDETSNGHVRIWDISQLPTVREVGSYQIGQNGGTVHNVYVHGDLLYVTYYKEGLRILSIRDPHKPVEIAHYDTYTTTANGCFGGIYAGCWGVHPWTLDKVFVSDLDNGGFILRLTAVPNTFTAQATTVKPGNTIDLDMSYKNAAVTSLNGFGFVFLTAINSSPLVFSFLAEAKLLTANQTIGHKLKIPIPSGLPNLTLDFTSFSGTFQPLTLSESHPLTIQIRN